MEYSANGTHGKNALPPAVMENKHEQRLAFHRSLVEMLAHRFPQRAELAR
jgi:hypothetical protein